MARRSNAFSTYWRTIWKGFFTALSGLGVTWKYLFSKPVTVEYPFQLPQIPDGWRGTHAFERDRCIKCRQCEKICPVSCITLELEGKGKDTKIVHYDVDYGTCLFCNLCVEVCPVDCIWLTDDWDLACYRREDVYIHFEDRDPDTERKKLWPSMRAAREAASKS